MPDGPLGGWRGSASALLDGPVRSALTEGLDVRTACNSWYSGAYLLETVPSVMYILARHGHEPEVAIEKAVNETRDNDTVAADVAVTRRTCRFYVSPAAPLTSRGLLPLTRDRLNACTSRASATRCSRAIVNGVSRRSVPGRTHCIHVMIGRAASCPQRPRSPARAGTPVPQATVCSSGSSRAWAKTAGSRSGSNTAPSSDCARSATPSTPSLKRSQIRQSCRVVTIPPSPENLDSASAARELASSRMGSRTLRAESRVPPGVPSDGSRHRCRYGAHGQRASTPRESDLLGAFALSSIPARSESVVRSYGVVSGIAC